MDIHTVKYIYTEDLLSESAMELLSNSNLPWTFGDCALSLVDPKSFLTWLKEQERELSTEDSEKVVDKLKSIDRGVLIAL